MREQVSHAGWKTFCFGRYLVDLPQQAKVSAVYKIRGKNIEFVPGEEPAKWRCCINQGRGEAVLTFTRNDMAVTL
ncbi:hypothetical protein Q3P10_02790, partial [Ralstonia pseudosolanacearum]|nr:hypothetical protein [Ralstonia pseudosolanacearum]